MAKGQLFVRLMGFKESTIRMVYSHTRRLVLLSLLFFLPATVMVCVLAWNALGDELSSEHHQISRFEELASYRVVNSVGFELFNLNFNFSFKIKQALEDPTTDWPKAVAAMVDSFQRRDGTPDLLDEVYLVTETRGGTLSWSQFEARVWKAAKSPVWAPATETLFYQINDPRVSLERPTLIFPLPPDGSNRRVAVVRYRVQEVLQVIVPALAEKAFARGTGKYDFSTSVVYQGPTDASLNPKTADMMVPLVPDIPFSEWLRIYLDRQSDYFPPPDPRFDSLRDLQKRNSPEARWALQVHLRPDGLAHYLQGLQTRNAILVSLLLVSMWAVIGLFLYSVVRILQAGMRERAFVSLVSHELKTPLTAIRSLSENLAEGYVPNEARVREYGSQIKTQSVRLGELVENILSLASLQSSEGTLVLEEFDVEAMVREFSDLGLKISGDSDCWLVRGNAVAIRAVLGGLVSNAFKYGVHPGSSPDVEVALHKEYRWNRWWVGISVVDHGPGLTPEEKHHLFQPFHKGRQGTEAQTPGGGLGLSLVKATMDHLGGRVQAQCTPGGGLTMTIWLKEQRKR